MVAQIQAGGAGHPRQNTDERPIENKYREGKLKRTLERESKDVNGQSVRRVRPVLKHGPRRQNPLQSTAKTIGVVGVGGFGPERR